VSQLWIKGQEGCRICKELIIVGLNTTDIYCSIFKRIVKWLAGCLYISARFSSTVGSFLVLPDYMVGCNFYSAMMNNSCHGCDIILLFPGGYMATPYKCQRCGLSNSMGSTHCHACGIGLSTSSKQPQALPPTPKTVSFGGTSTPTVSSVPAVPIAFSIHRLFGWKAIEGQVIHIEQPYMARPDFSWIGLLIRLLVCGIAFFVFGPIALGIIFAMIIFSTMLSIFLPFNRRSGPGFISSVATQFVGFFLTSKLLSPKADVPVRDVRLRDKSGQEHLIRLKGDLVVGNVNVGDEIEVEGYDRKGMLMLVRGKNKRTRSEIRIKCR